MDTGKLVICPTPIGNLGDITLRALAALREADLVYSEDTRVTGKLLAAHGIRKRLERLDEAAISKGLEHVLEHIRAGQSVVYCSDAGMPGVSDPGCRLLRAAREAGLAVEVLPGASAGVLAYVASGFANPRYYFGGFFPRKASEQEKLLQSLKPLDAVLVFYESPRRLVASLRQLAEAFSLREIAVCRELTKLHEEVYRGLAPAVLKEFERRASEGAIRGEIVLVVDAPCESEAMSEMALKLFAARLKARELKAGSMAAGEAESGGEKVAARLSTKDIAARLQEEFGISRNAAYEIAAAR
ncbi:MAG: 16S rRNA (cytidine(1402)-2'-O)-methyltransferase [Eggerthellaceae bacterium]|nr:16S rRNA (cytidine(1402)-2'-O)-methyltransferase [Eggerthellaceae bacterium]